MKNILTKNKALMAVTIFLTLITSVAYVYLAFILKQVTDTALSGDFQAFYKVLMFSISYMIFIGIINFAAALCKKRYIVNTTRSIRSNIFRKIIHFNTEDYFKVNSTDYLSAITNDITLVEQNYLVPLFSVFENLIIFLGAVIMLLVISPLITGVLIGFLLLTIIVPSLFGKALQKRQDHLSKALSAFTTKSKDLLSGFEVIRSFGIQKQVMHQFEDKNHKLFHSKFQSDKITVISESFAELLAYFTLFSGIFIGAYLMMKGHFTAGTLLALIQLSSSLVNPLMVGMQMITLIQGVKPIITRVEGFIDHKETQFYGKAIPTFNEQIQMKQVSFSYDDGKDVLNNIDFVFKKNKKYAIVGKSGCGKSTLVKLLTGNYSNYKGEIYFDQQELMQLSLEELLQTSAVIHQNIYLFDDTVKDNICLYEKFSKERMEKALLVSGVNRFEDDLSDKRMTMVGEGGNRLSGGQRQRVAVARALIAEKPLLILDEGTSAIDMKTAYEIESSLLEEEALTLITITHQTNQEILGRYDEIIFMDEGKIIQSGDYNQLVKTCEKFNAFIN